MIDREDMRDMIYIDIDRDLYKMDLSPFIVSMFLYSLFYARFGFNYMLIVWIIAFSSIFFKGNR